MPTRHRPLNLALLLLLCGCTHEPAAPVAAVEIKSVHPAVPVVTIISCQVISADFPQFSSDHIHFRESYESRPTYVEIELRLHMPEDFIRLPKSPATITSFADNFGTDLLPASQTLWWPNHSGYYDYGKSSPDHHQAMIRVSSETALTPGATSLNLQGAINVPAGRNLTTLTFPHTPMEIGSQFTAGSVTFKLTRMETDAPHKDSNTDRILPAFYRYHWDVEGPLDLVQSVQFLDSSGNLLPSYCGMDTDNSRNEMSVTLLTPIDAPTLRVAFFQSAEMVSVPLDVTATLAGNNASPAAPAASETPPASRPADAVRVTDIRNNSPLPKADRITTLFDQYADDPPDNPMNGPGTLIGCAALFPNDRIADFNVNDVVIESITDDQHTNLLPGAAVFHGLHHDTRALPLDNYRPFGDRHACFFSIHLPVKINPAAKTITLRGKLTAQLSKAPENITLPAANLHAGQLFTAGPYKITLADVNTANRRSDQSRYDFDTNANPRIDSITFLDAAGQELPTQHYYKYKNPSIIQYTGNPGATPASFRISYFADPKPKTVSFSLTVTLGN